MNMHRAADKADSGHARLKPDAIAMLAVLFMELLCFISAELIRHPLIHSDNLD
jgi:hypothetical protein